MNKSNILSVGGDAYNRGLTYGSQARDLILKGVKHYMEMWEQSGRPSGELFDILDRFQPVIAEYDDEILREMEGIAAGAKLQLREVLLLNARYELMVVAFFGDPGAGVTRKAECTSLAAASPATTDGHTFVAQNWDLTVESGERSLLLEVIQNDRPNIVTHVEAGLVGHKGLNSSGLGLCVNALGSQHDDFVPGVPVFVLARSFLNSDSLDEGRRCIERAGRAASVNFTFGSDTGEVGSLEVTPIDVACIESVEGRAAHANVFCDLREGRGVKDELAGRFPVLAERSTRARELIDSAEVNLEALNEIFKDRANKPESICRHLDDQPPDAPVAFCLETVVSMIMDLTDRTVYITDGPPDRSPYKRLAFDSLRSVNDR